MRNFGNDIKNYYGTLSITAQTGLTALTVSGGIASDLINNSGLIGCAGLLQVTGSGTTGIALSAGTEIFNSGSAGTIQAYNRSTSVYLPMNVSGSTVSLNVSGTTALSIAAPGNVTIVAPSSGAALTLGQYLQLPAYANLHGQIQITPVGTGAVGQSAFQYYSDNNLYIDAPTTGTPSGGATYLRTGTGSTIPALTLAANQGAVFGAATGGSQGAGTVNATGLYVNGVAVGVGVTQTTGSFTGTLTGCTTSPTATFNYCIVGKIAFLYNTSSLQGTSNTSVCTITGMPAALTPAGSPTVAIPVASNGIQLAGCALPSGTTLTLGANFGAAGSFATSGSKGIYVGTVISYPLN
jgi:hypothetical protein